MLKVLLYFLWNAIIVTYVKYCYFYYGQRILKIVSIDICARLSPVLRHTTMLSIIFFSLFRITIKLIHRQTHVNVYKCCMSKLGKILSFTEIKRIELGFARSSIRRQRACVYPRLRSSRKLEALILPDWMRVDVKTSVDLSSPSDFPFFSSFNINAYVYKALYLRKVDTKAFKSE